MQKRNQEHNKIINKSVDKGKFTKIIYSMRAQKEKK